MTETRLHIHAPAATKYFVRVKERFCRTWHIVADVPTKREALDFACVLTDTKGHKLRIIQVLAAYERYEPSLVVEMRPR